MQVELQHIHKTFGSVHANNDISLVVKPSSIHGLLGENGAGKSTLVKILSGFIARDRGNIILDGRSVEIKTPAHAIKLGIGMLHQDPLDFPPLSVLDNFMAGKSGGLFVNKHTAARELHQLASQFNFALNIKAKVSELTVGERQQLELLRLLSLGVNTLILDEPTTGISASQKSALFEALKKLAAQGKSIIFVSHKLEDVEELCDRVTVMRQGQVVGEAEIPDHTEASIRESIAPVLVEMMFGKELPQPNKPHTATEDVMLQIKNIIVSSDRLQVQIDDFTAQKGEIIGLAGLEGSGQHLLLLLCAGLLAADSGSLHLGGTDMTRRPYKSYLKAGVGYIPADRLKEGLISGLSIQEHVALRSAEQGLFINWRNTLKTTQTAIEYYNIRGRATTKVERLSGGNQQRTQLALLSDNLNLLLMEHPTRGLDIESSLWVWQQLIERCKHGTTILFATSDLDEIVQYSDRILVFSGGMVSAPIDAATLTADKLGQAIGGKFV